MKLHIFILLIFSQNILAASPSKKEVDTYLEAIKEVEVNQQVLGLPQFKECKSKYEDDFKKDATSAKQNVQECVEKKFKEIEESDKDAFVKLAKSIDLKSYNPEAAKSSTSIREYLADRIRKSMQGDNYEEARKGLAKRKYVSHNDFYQLYMEQIGKNTLLEVSKYCLENFGFDNREYMVRSISKGLKIKALKPISSLTSFFDAKGEPLVTLTPNLRNIDPSAAPEVFTEIVDFSYGKMVEYQLCDLNTEAECKSRYKTDENGSYLPFRSLAEAIRLKEAEFELAKNKNLGVEFLKNKYAECASEIVRNMCDVYKCNNVYNLSSPDSKQMICRNPNIIGDSWDQNFNKDAQGISLESKDPKGSIACNLMNRLEEYRYILKETEDIKKDNLNHTAVSGFNLLNSFEQKFNSGKEINKLTSISSKELTTKVKSINSSEEEADKLKTTCMDEIDGVWQLKPDADKNKECELLMAKTNQEEFDKIELDTESKTEIILKQLSRLKDDTKYFDDFVKKHNLTPEDLKDDEKITAIMEQEYKSKKMALIDSLNQKYLKEKKLTTDNKDKATVELQNDIANQSLAEIEQHKKRIQNLFEYSNIVSSYLVAKDDSGKEVSKNTVSRDLELQGNLEYQKYFSDSDSSSGGGSSNFVYSSAIDKILGIGSNEKK